MAIANAKAFHEYGASLHWVKRRTHSAIIEIPLEPVDYRLQKGFRPEPKPHTGSCASALCQMTYSFD